MTARPRPTVSVPPREDVDAAVSAFEWTGRAGDIVFRAGDEASELVIVEEGEIELMTEDASGTHRVARLGPGDVCGERAMLEGRPHDVTARVTRDCRLLRLDDATLRDLLEHDPRIAVLLLRRLAHRLDDARHAFASTAASPSADASATIATSAAIPAATRGATHAREAVASRVPNPAPRFVVEPSGREFPWPDEEESAIGRVDRTTGHTPPIDFTGVDRQRSLSRMHATALRRGGTYYLRAEEGAANGTFVNGRRLQPGADTRLRDGVRIRFGMVDTIFRCS